MHVTSIIHFVQYILSLIVFLTIAMSGFSASADNVYHSYFNMTSKRSEDLKLFPKWTSVLARFTKEENAPDGECSTARHQPCAIKTWQGMLDTLRGKSFEEQLSAINTWSNDHPYIIDQINWGMEDYWETPFEFMAVNGDCEDYAISKYYSLRALGISEDKMRIIVVQDFNLGGIIHAILGVYDNDELLILDNQIKQVMPARKIYHYRPIYGVNEGSWWEYSPKSS